LLKQFSAAIGAVSNPHQHRAAPCVFAFSFTLCLLERWLVP
jgi:hypothetical protein